MAGEDEAGRTPPTGEQQTPQALTQQHTTVAAAPTAPADERKGEERKASESKADERPAQSAQPDRPSEKPSAEQAATDKPATEQAPAEEVPAEQAPAQPGFGERGRMRRRARFLRKARELAYRDLGGLVYDLHRFGQRNDPVVLAKLATLSQIDVELRALEEALREFKPVTVLREVGIAACPRCAAIHGNEDRFCPGCGLAFDADADRPLSTAPVTTQSVSPVTADTGTSVVHGVAGSPLASAASALGPPVTAISPVAASPPAVASTPVAAPSPPPSALPSPAPAPSPSIPARTGSDGAASELTAIERLTGRAPAKPERDHDSEDEPTQILRPPTREP